MSLNSNQQKKLLKNYGEWALITGASSGIGKAITNELAKAGFNLILVARNQQALEQQVKEYQTQYQTTSKVIVQDLSKLEQLPSLYAQIEPLNIGLFVAAAGFGTSGKLVESDLVQEVNMLTVNCNVVLQMTHYFCQQFKQKGRGGIILFSSIVAFQGVPFAAHYAATKAYIQTLAEALNDEMKPYGVDVLSAAPGPVKTAFEARSNMEMDLYLLPEQVAAPILQALGKKTTVYPGLLTKILTYSLKMTPRFGKIKIMKQVMGGMTAHQRS